MQIIIAPDSFKECLSAKEVVEHVAIGIKSVMPAANITGVPIADGGEGSVEALVTATNGSIVEVDSVDALMRPIKSFFGALGNKKTAVIEMAAASGIGLIAPNERNPLQTSTFGTGLLIKEVLDKGYTNIILGIGGSATNDGGMGMARALGYKFLDKNNKEVEPGGENLKYITNIDISEAHPKLKNVNITVACDVTNPLCGPEGASAVFGPQKGASPEMVAELDENLKLFSELIDKQLNKKVANVPGSGAAGGLGAGLLAFTQAELKPGFEIVKTVTSLENHIKNADLIFTAEGKIDFQTQFGKTPYGVAQLAKKYNKPVIALAGSIGDGADVLLEKGFTALFSITNKPLTLQESMDSAGKLLENISKQVMRVIKNYLPTK